MRLKDYTLEQLVARGAADIACAGYPCNECPMNTIDDGMCQSRCADYILHRPAEVLKAFGVEPPENLAYKAYKVNADAVISGLKEQIVTLKDKLTAETARADKTAQKYEDLDNKYTEALTAVVNLQAEAGSWKQVAKWLCKQMRKIDG